MFIEIVVNVDYLVLEKVNLVVKQSNLVPEKNYLVAGKIVTKQFILVLDSVYLVVQ